LDFSGKRSVATLATSFQTFLSDIAQLDGLRTRTIRAYGYELAAAAAARIQLVADQTNGGAYNPNSAKAKVGDTVQWTWTDDSAQHSVTSDDGKFDSGLQGKGSTFDQKFTSAGTYKYHCSVHPQMLGQVTVQ
jgi:plastocyanin